MAVTDSVVALQPDLSTLEAGILAALHLRLAADSRSFARIFGVEHALVLRGVETLVGDVGLISVTTRNERTQRTHYAATETGLSVLGHLHG
nr:hypothetical protein [Methylobacterium sp. BTF04]